MSIIYSQGKIKEGPEDELLKVQVFCEIFRTHTHTLRLVSPWGRPGNLQVKFELIKLYPTAQRLKETRTDSHITLGLF